MMCPPEQGVLFIYGRKMCDLRPRNECFGVNVMWHGLTYHLCCHGIVASTGMCNFRKTISCIIQITINLCTGKAEQSPHRWGTV